MYGGLYHEAAQRRIVLPERKTRGCVVADPKDVLCLCSTRAPFGTKVELISVIVECIVIGKQSRGRSQLHMGVA